MQQELSMQSASFLRGVTSYFASVTIGALAMIAIATLTRFTTLESAKNLSLQRNAFDFIIVTGLEFVLSWLIGLVVMVAPHALLSLLARTPNIHSWTLYMTGGIAVTCDTQPCSTSATSCTRRN